MMFDEFQIAYEDHHNECPSRSYKCVPRHLCNLEGFIVYNKPFQIPKYRKQDRLPLTVLLNIITIKYIFFLDFGTIIYN